MGDIQSTLQAPAQGLTLHFFDWSCGHHQQTPAPISGLSSKEQAETILRAIAAAISQPGNARAWLADEAEAEECYLTDDYVSWHGSKAARPVIILFPRGTDLQLTDEDREDVPDFFAGMGGYGQIIGGWDGRTTLRDGDIALTTMTRRELEMRERPDTEIPAVVVEREASWLQEAREYGASWRVQPSDSEA